MARMDLGFLILVAMATFIDKTWAVSPIDFGMTMSVRAYEAICWYENLKVFPKTNTRGFGDCEGNAKLQQNTINESDFYKTNANSIEKDFGAMMTEAMSLLPEKTKYRSECSKYLSDSQAEPISDESDAINDGGMKPYPFRAFSYCMMKTLRDSNGQKGVEAVKNERTVKRKNWRQALVDRENEFRALHNVGPLQLVPELNDAAQVWSDKIAKECKMYHSTYEQRQYKDGVAGESLMGGGGNSEKDTFAYVAANGWYEEIKDYPYPDGYNGSPSSDPLFLKIGHFTQSVWKETQYVGYGLANNNCSSDAPSTYVTARYYPPGNGEGTYQQNVLPPKGSGRRR